MTPSEIKDLPDKEQIGEFTGRLSKINDVRGPYGDDGNYMQGGLFEDPDNPNDKIAVTVWTDDDAPIFRVSQVDSIVTFSDEEKPGCLKTNHYTARKGPNAGSTVCALQANQGIRLFFDQAGPPAKSEAPAKKQEDSQRREQPREEPVFEALTMDELIERHTEIIMLQEKHLTTQGWSEAQARAAAARAPHNVAQWWFGHKDVKRD